MLYSEHFDVQYVFYSEHFDLQYMFYSEHFDIQFVLCNEHFDIQREHGTVGGSLSSLGDVSEVWNH